jgi:hypothetical protein
LLYLLVKVLKLLDALRYLLERPVDFSCEKHQANDQVSDVAAVVS